VYDGAWVGNAYHQPAYAAVARWAAGRRVVVAAPTDMVGPSRLVQAEARRVVLVGECPWATPDVEVRRGIPELPLPDGDADVVVCVEAYATFPPVVRRQLIREAHRVLRRGGMFIASVPAVSSNDDDADFWALESELGDAFIGTTMVAQMPWEGVSLAPVLDDERVPTVTLEETLLEEAPEATHYLAVAFRGYPAPDVFERLRSECVLVPVPTQVDEPAAIVAPEPPAQPAPEPPAPEPEPPPPVVEPEPVDDGLQERVAELETQLEARDTDIRVLTGNLEALEASLARVSERAEARSRELEVVQKERRELQRTVDSLGRERDATTRNLEMATAERAGAQQLSDRVEAELDQARRRLAEQTRELSERSAEASRLSGELTAVKDRLANQEAALEQTRTRAEELTRTAARQDEQSRMLAEVASDRDRLREELKRRTETIQSLEERLWTAREDVQKERLEAVRIASEVDRLRDAAERSQLAEREGRAKIESLSTELRTIEVQRADAAALLRSRDEQLERMNQDLRSLTSESADVDGLRAELAERSQSLGRVREQLEQVKTRAAEAAHLAKRREEQLSTAGEDLQKLETRVETAESEAAGLRSELDVKSLEVEQLAASVANLQAQLDDTRQARTHSEDTSRDLQRRLELNTEELDQVRNRLRSRDQELADIVAARETSGVELYKLRQELEATSQVNEALEATLEQGVLADASPSPSLEAGWPDGAVSEIRRLRGQLVAQTRRHAEQLERFDKDGGRAADEDELRKRLRMADLEAQVRADEQEYLLTLLESAEQRIWEMNDASDRNAARLAAGLAQLEKTKEQLDETLDELEVTRKQLAASQARALEQERLAASERAKLLRAGIDPDGLPNVGAESEDPFADFDDEKMIELLPSSIDEEPVPEKGAPAVEVRDQTGSASSSVREGPRIVVEAVDDDDWFDESAEPTQPRPGAKGAARTKEIPKPPPIGAPTRKVDDPTVPRLRMSGPPKVAKDGKDAANSGHKK